jgi:hypothetical protein
MDYTHQATLLFQGCQESDPTPQTPLVVGEARPILCSRSLASHTPAVHAHAAEAMPRSTMLWPLGYVPRLPWLGRQHCVAKVVPIAGIHARERLHETCDRAFSAMAIDHGAQ